MFQYVDQGTEIIPKTYQKNIYRMKWTLFSEIRDKVNGRIHNLTVLMSMEKMERHSEFILSYLWIACRFYDLLVV